MSLDKQFIDGTLTLSQQEDTLNFMEQVGFAKVINYQKSPDEHGDMKVNQVTLDDAAQKPKPLHLEAVNSGADATPVITAQLKAGRQVVFHEIAFVEGDEQMVLGFR
jgi:hypothetical protein